MEHGGRRRPGDGGRGRLADRLLSLDGAHPHPARPAQSGPGAQRLSRHDLLLCLTLGALQVGLARLWRGPGDPDLAGRHDRPVGRETANPRGGFRRRRPPLGLKWRPRPPWKIRTPV